MSLHRGKNGIYFSGYNFYILETLLAEKMKLSTLAT